MHKLVWLGLDLLHVVHHNLVHDLPGHVQLLVFHVLRNGCLDPECKSQILGCLVVSELCRLNGGLDFFEVFRLEVGHELLGQEDFVGLTLWVGFNDATHLSSALTLRVKGVSQFFLRDFGLAIRRATVDVVAVQALVKYQE